MVIYVNRRAILSLVITITLIFFTTISLKTDLHQQTLDSLFESDSPPSPPATPPELPRHPIYKPQPPDPPIQIVDNFPLAASAASKTDLPPIPSWNIPPKPHVPEKTPLFIGFTRNWRILQQAVVSYITAGWPPEDIYVIENTGTMDANRNGLLTLQNPFYLNHTRLHDLLGVNIIVTPTLLTFAQLQNFFLFTAIENKYPTYFWSHMDIVALPYEEREPYESLYALAVSVLRSSLDPSYKVDENTGAKQRWALQFFAYDRLALVNTKAYEEVGGWDTQVPFYMTDCDMHERLSMAGLAQEEAKAGLVYDVSDSFDDLEILYRKKGIKDPSFSLPPGDDWGKEAPLAEEMKAERKREVGVVERGVVVEKSWLGDDTKKKKTWVEDERNSAVYRKMMDTADAMQRHKHEQKGGRNTWQARQGGLGVEKEPYYKNPQGFETAMRMWQDFGRDVFNEKWGHRGCDIRGSGLGMGDEWRVEHDWDRPVESQEHDA